MIPSIRESILAAKDKESLGSVVPENSSLMQLKYIFASLKTYESRYYNAKDFCTHFENQPLNVSEQMDVDEFFNLLVDKLEIHLKGSKYDNPFLYEFGGTISNDLIRKGCPHISEKEDGFSNIILSVKKSLQESLANYVEGEMLEGDNAVYCEKCDKKVNTLRRTSIKKLPRTLILVLKRFEFDYDNMCKFKVNSFCDFPLELDMEPYTQEYLKKHQDVDIQDENTNGISNRKNFQNINQMMDIDNESVSSVRYNNYKYNLKGVIIHTGTAESGHYYSIIKDNYPNSQRWLEFNDSNVKEYDFDDLAGEAYGGSDTIINKDNKREVIDRSTNAYVLFYQRDVNPGSNIEANYYYQNNYIHQLVNDAASHSSRYQYKISNISEKILDKVNTDNFQFWVGKNLFSKEYMEFVIELLIQNSQKNLKLAFDRNNNLLTINEKLQMILKMNTRDAVFARQIQLSDQFSLSHVPNELDDILFKFSSIYFFSIMLRAKDKSQLPKLLKSLKALINISINNANFILEEFSHHEVVQEYIIDCVVIEMRNMAIGVVYCAMLKIFNSFISGAISKDIFIKSSLIVFMNNLLQIVVRYNVEKKDSLKDLTHVYALIWRFANLGGGVGSAIYQATANVMNINIDFINYTKSYLVNVGFLEFVSLIYQRKSNDTIDISKCEFVQKTNTLLNEPRHKFISQKLTYKIDKLSAFEEILEKKQIDKMILQRNEGYLLMAYCDILSKCDKFTSPRTTNVEPRQVVYPEIELPDRLKDMNDLTNPLLLMTLFSEVKSKQSSLCLAMLLEQVCYNNPIMTNAVNGSICKVINALDSFELEYVMTIFRTLIKIGDSLQTKRIKDLLLAYSDVLLGNLKFYKFTEWNVDFIIRVSYINLDL